MRPLPRKILLFLFLLFFMACRASAFRLDDFFSPREQKITRVPPPAPFLQKTKAPSELISYDGKQKILGFPIKEVIFRYDRNRFRSAEILIDYTNRRTPEANGAQRIRRVEKSLASRISARLQTEPETEELPLPNGRSFFIRKWVGPHYRFSVHSTLAKDPKNFSFVFLRIVSLSEPEVPFRELLKVRNPYQRKTVKKGEETILHIPFRAQLPGTAGCWFATAARIFDYMGSEINPMTVRILVDSPEDKDVKRSMPFTKFMGCNYRFARINEKKKVNENCLLFLFRYNEQSRAMRRKEIALEDGGKRWKDNMRELDPIVLKRVNLDFVDKEKLWDYRNQIRDHIDKGYPVEWGVVRCIDGAHARAIIGYNLKKDMIYYSDSWSLKEEVKKMPFLSAYLMTHFLGFYSVKDASPSPDGGK